MPSDDSRAPVAGVELLGPSSSGHYAVRHATWKRPIKPKPMKRGHFGAAQVSVFNHCQSGNVRPSGIDQNVPIRRRNWTEMATKWAADKATQPATSFVDDRSTATGAT
jgi:hypothetical protein